MMANIIEIMDGLEVKVFNYEGMFEMVVYVDGEISESFAKAMGFDTFEIKVNTGKQVAEMVDAVKAYYDIEG